MLAVAQGTGDIPERLRLLHPVYLDVPMMISFLASLQDGVVFEDSTTRTGARSTTRDREASGKVRIPSFLSLLGFDASGRMGRSEREEASEEVKAVRQHTAASLFNALYAVLLKENLLTSLTNAADLTNVSPGDVVEIAGDFVGNPLEPVVAFVKQAVPYFNMTQDADPIDPAALEVAHAAATEALATAQEFERRAAKAGRSGNPAKQAEALGVQHQAKEQRRLATEQTALVETALKQAAERIEQELAIRLLSQVGDDLAETRVQDTVINADDFKAILTMSAEFFTDATRAYLRAGVFRSIGKVTRVLDGSDDVNLLRRTVLGAAGPKVARDLLKGAEEDSSLDLEIFDPIIKAPAVQVLPLAVFV